MRQIKPAVPGLPSGAWQSGLEELQMLASSSPAAGQVSSSADRSPLRPPHTGGPASIPVILARVRAAVDVHRG